jgi:limonene-1,2-epoxide hydrolase
MKMLDLLKQKAIAKGMELMQSPAVGKLMESEQVGVVIEKALTVPFKVSGALTVQKERLVSLLDLATQEDIDEVRRTMTRVEGVLKDIRREAEALREAGTEAASKSKIVK